MLFETHLPSTTDFSSSGITVKPQVMQPASATESHSHKSANESHPTKICVDIFWLIRGLLACLPFSVAVPANRCRWSSGWRAPGLEGLGRCHGQGLRGHTVWCFRVEIGFTYYYGRTFEDASQVSHAGLHSWNVLTSGPGNICKYPILLLPGPCLRQFQVHAGLLHNFWHEVPRPCNPNWWDGCAKKRWPSRVGSHSSCIVLLDYVNILYIACMEDVDGSNSHSHIYSFQTCVSQATKALNP